MIESALTIVFTAGAVYGAIRADIRSAVNTANDAKREAEKANTRIDNFLLKEIKN